MDGLVSRWPILFLVLQKEVLRNMTELLATGLRESFEISEACQVFQLSLDKSEECTVHFFCITRTEIVHQIGFFFNAWNNYGREISRPSDRYDSEINFERMLKVTNLLHLRMSQFTSTPPLYSFPTVFDINITCGLQFVRCRVQMFAMDFCLLDIIYYPFVLCMRNVGTAVA